MLEWNIFDEIPEWFYTQCTTVDVNADQNWCSLVSNWHADNNRLISGHGLAGGLKISLLREVEVILEDASMMIVKYIAKHLDSKEYFTISTNGLQLCMTLSLISYLL